MTRLALFLMTSLVLAVAGVPAAAASQTQTPQAKKEKKVWTNEDLEELRGKVQLSVIGQPPTETPAGSGEQPAATDLEKSGAKTERYVRAKDPKRYSEQIAALRAEIHRIDGEIHQLREFRASARTSQGGLVLGQSNIPLTPENQIQQLAAQRREVQRQIDALEDQARRNNISPGAIR